MILSIPISTHWSEMDLWLYQSQEVREWTHLVPKTGGEIICNPKDQLNVPFWSTNTCFTLHFTSKMHLQPPWVRKLRQCPSRHAMKLKGSDVWVMYSNIHIRRGCSSVSYCLSAWIPPFHIPLDGTEMLQAIFSRLPTDSQIDSAAGGSRRSLED